MQSPKISVNPPTTMTGGFKEHGPDAHAATGGMELNICLAIPLNYIQPTLRSVVHNVIDICVYTESYELGSKRIPNRSVIKTQVLHLIVVQDNFLFLHTRPYASRTAPCTPRTIFFYFLSCISQVSTSPSSTSSQPLNMAAIWAVKLWPVVVM